MTFVHVKLMGRYGNQLFQYWVGRYIADTLNWPLKLHVDCGILYLNPTTFPQLRLPSHCSAWSSEYGSGHDEDPYNIDIPKVINDHRESQTPVIISKFIENSKIIMQYEQYIRSLYHRTSFPPLLDNVVIHIRLGDIRNYWDSFGEQFTEFAVEIAQKYRDIPCLIVSEDPGDPHTIHVLSRLQQNGVNATVKPASDFQGDFDTLMTARVLVATNSTFSWWAGFLNPYEGSEKYIAVSDKQFASTMRRKHLVDHMTTVRGWRVYDLDLQMWL